MTAPPYPPPRRPATLAGAAPANSALVQATINLIRTFTEFSDHTSPRIKDLTASIEGLEESGLDIGEAGIDVKNMLSDMGRLDQASQALKNALPILVGDQAEKPQLAAKLAKNICRELVPTCLVGERAVSDLARAYERLAQHMNTLFKAGNLTNTQNRAAHNFTTHTQTNLDSILDQNFPAKVRTCLEALVTALGSVEKFI